MRSASRRRLRRRPRARRRARPRGRAATRSSSVVLPAPGALIRLTTVTPRAVEVGAVRARRSSRSRRGRPRAPSRTCDACLLLDLDRLDLELVAAHDRDVAARRTPGSGTAARRLPLVAARPAAQRRRHDLELEPRALADGRRARRCRSRTRATPARPGAGARRGARTTRHRAGRRRGARPCRRSRSRGRARASRRSSSTVSATSATARLDRGLRPARVSPMPTSSTSLRLAGDHDHLAGPAADRLDEAQHGLRVHAVRVDHARRPRSRPSTDRVGLHHVQRPGLAALPADVDEDERRRSRASPRRRGRARRCRSRRRATPSGSSRARSRFATSPPKPSSREPEVADRGDQDLIRARPSGDLHLVGLEEEEAAALAQQLAASGRCRR